MKLYEFITPSDPITFYAPDNDIAEAVAIIVGSGKAGIKAVDGNETPNTLIFLTGFTNKQEDRFRATMENRGKEVIAAGKTFAVCEVAYREEYDELTENSTNTKRVKRWDDRHRSSMSDWCGYARGLKLKKQVK